VSGPFLLTAWCQLATIRRNGATTASRCARRADKKVPDTICSPAAMEARDILKLSTADNRVEADAQKRRAAQKHGWGHCLTLHCASAAGKTSCPSRVKKSVRSVA
jgi:hypothetical protein